MKFLEELGDKGLRTLMIAERELSSSEYDDFQNKYEVIYFLILLI